MRKTLSLLSLLYDHASFFFAINLIVKLLRVLPNKRTWAKDGEEAHEEAKGFLKRWAPSSKYNNHRLLRLNDEKPLAEQN